ncbi:hypothetical protein [Streptacidiphilus albus]|nr:hypothetical protein [Streptacidiphilus albus]
MIRLVAFDEDALDILAEAVAAPGTAGAADAAATLPGLTSVHPST